MGVNAIDPRRQNGRDSPSCPAGREVFYSTKFGGSPRFEILIRRSHAGIFQFNGVANFSKVILNLSLRYRVIYDSILRILWVFVLREIRGSVMLLPCN